MFEPVLPQPDFAAQEEEVLAYWQANSIFEKSVEKNKEGGKGTYVIYDGPPTANAKPPLHTMLPMSFKDLVGRYMTMRGYHVPRQAGWDTHGLPVEVQMEKKMGLAGKRDILNLVPGDQSASIKMFNEACRTSVWEFKQEWDKFVPRIGYWVDTKNPYVTYDPSYVEGVWEVFKNIWDTNVVYKGYKVVPYCPRCGTGLSSHEVSQEYQDIKDVSVFVSLPLVDNPSRSMLAWTTTPWTLPGNVALAVGADMDYVVVRQEEKEYILAKSRLEVLKGDYVIVESMKGSDLVGLHYSALYPEVLANVTEDKHMVVAADFVTTEDGTGIVHIAVMYGEDDFNLGKQIGLPMVHTVGPDGVYLENVQEFAGMYIRDALVPILKDLTEKDRLYGKQTITHSYPHCWRCKTALVYYATNSWFISMSTLRNELVKNNDNIDWYPDHVKHGRFGDFIKEARDWAVSRERFWGTPMPVWKARESDDYICVGSFDELKSLAKDPSLIGEGFDPHRPFVDDIVLVKDGVEYVREPVVLDVWFDSGSMPYASGRQKQGLFPADFIAEATDQTRGWFYTLLAISTITQKQSSYKRVVCAGLLMDENGRKMSKSIGNIMDPWETFSHFGVDPIRWYLYTVNSPGETKSLGLKDLQTFRKSLTLLWNVFNYFVTYANVAGFESLTPSQREELRARQDMPVLDAWILSRQSQVGQQVTAYLDDYDFMRAGRALDAYIDELSTWYLRRSRKRSDATFFAVLHDILLNVVTMMAPFTPFIAEKIFRVLRTKEMPESVHLMDWPEALEGANTNLENEMRSLRSAVELGLSVRAAEKIKVRQPLAAAYVQTSIELRPELLEILAEELNVLQAIPQKYLIEGMPCKKDEWNSVGLDTKMTDELIQAGLARELLRHIQQLRKNRGLQPGQEVLLVVDPTQRSVVEPLLEGYPHILAEAFVRVEAEHTWKVTDAHEISLDGQSVSMDLVA